MISISKLQKRFFKTVVPFAIICTLSIVMLAGCSEKKSEETKNTEEIKIGRAHV